MKLLTGVCNNIVQNIDKINLWATSFERVVEDGEVILMAYNPTDEDIYALKANNIRYVGIRENTNETVNNMRLLPMSNFLKDNAEKYKAVLYTDVFDVVFLTDPFTPMEVERYDIFVGGEGILHSQEPWNMDVMNKCWPQYSDSIRSQEVFCSGVIGGTMLGVSNWLKEMNNICQYSKKGHDIEDQGAMNIAIMQNTKYKVKYFDINDNWVLHMATGGPTQFFESWGFRRHIENKFGKIPNWKDYSIVHQFNRIPHIHEEIKTLI